MSTKKEKKQNDVVVFAGVCRKVQEKKLQDMLTKLFCMEMDEETSAFMDQFAKSIASLYPKTVGRQFYSD